MTTATTTPSASPQWTPLHIEVMLHYYSSPIAHYHYGAPAVNDAIQDLFNHGLITPDGDACSGVYAATPRGHAFVALLRRTPLPTQKWCAPDGSPLEIN